MLKDCYYTFVSANHYHTKYNIEIINIIAYEKTAMRRGYDTITRRYSDIYCYRLVFSCSYNKYLVVIHIDIDSGIVYVIRTYNISCDKERGERQRKVALKMIIIYILRKYLIVVAAVEYPSIVERRLTTT